MIGGGCPWKFVMAGGNSVFSLINTVVGLVGDTFFVRKQHGARDVVEDMPVKGACVFALKERAFDS